ncbi:Protein of uncharacterised function (DUF3558) [Mycobacteroides abscessus subsp. abscessus]|uniref:Protein of uncharacterized function (DUF3558) n=1 Tax=Mycobacteroides abscessus subsp. massiliense TaxID=1962118 RepID=A0A1T8KTN9_9MYCO|nr:DUF3558 domain-containing protein [Mycobacteroides abscessus]MEC4903176.1 DUF3558 domain-containing protein [Mycobacteroides chelonae]ORA88333.1 hypothetical protein BST32_17475 [Mycobacteroides abscessus subsp. massiliense]SIE12622.1 Protein of uncharacterised function (DUF3558) [Mycobacteroides abscessus subsp. abscessus]SIF83078.1 Protein of uncharacterised function (DUF3558) [Mycobacteroides abscessus subsp. abscessus]SIG02842.1 Protein of uncharacterised function (DUF3558) [Mycobactero
MPNTYSRVCLAAVASTAVLISACGTTTGGIASTAPSTAGASSTSTTVSNSLVSPHPAPNQYNDGTTFDPCLAFTADELRSWGVKPESVEDAGASDRIQRGCTWIGDGWFTYVAVLNRPVSDYLNQENFPGSKPIQVGGLNGVTYQATGSGLPDCWVELPSQQASVGTLVSIQDPKLGPKAVPDTCAKATAVATVVARKLPK